tara:strand:+ start:118 stop:591 length:474 start_codon:yes stop_codon:yes gene_type:complete
VSIHKYSSWGRTRGPKNITGTIGGAVTLEANTNNMLGSASGYKLVGYATQNQRWLHVLVNAADDDSTPAAITVFGYCHAFERWFEIGASTMDTPITADDANIAPTAASIQAADVDTNEEDQVPSHKEYRRYDILGIDRVAFVGDDAESNVYAACSTF